MQILTRKEAEEKFGELDVVSTRLEHIGKGLRINMTFSNSNSLRLEYKVGKQKKVFWFMES